MSKTYKRTRNGNHTDWLPKKFTWMVKSLDEIKETEQELIDFIKNTHVYPIQITVNRKRFYFGEKLAHNEHFTHKIITYKERFTYTKWVNLSEVNIAKEKLKILQWVKKYPHRKNNIGDSLFRGYSKNPGFWNHDFCIVPGRARTKQTLKKIKKGELDPDDICFDDYKKPCPYYW